MIPRFIALPILGLIISPLPSLAHASQSAACAIQANALLRAYGYQEKEALPRISADSESQVISYPSKIFGVRLEKHSWNTGDTEIHVLSERAQLQYSWEAPLGCKPKRKSLGPPSIMQFIPRYSLASVPILHDKDFAEILRKKKRGLVYAWSPKMPLSIAGLKIVAKLAADFQLPITYVMDPGISKKNALSAIQHFQNNPEYLNRTDSFELLHRGLLLHFPSLFFYDEGRLRGAPVLGQRGEEGYRELILAFLNADAEKVRARPSPTAIRSIAIPAPVKIRKVTELPREFGYFDKPVWGTRWIGLHLDWSTGYYFNLDTGQLIDLGYDNDTYVTPHDHLYSIFWAAPGAVGGGALGIMENDEFLKIGLDSEYKPLPLYVDSSLNADYQSVGTLEMGAEKSRYRVITGGFENKLSYRDYEIQHRRGKNPPKVTPLGEAGIICSKTLGNISFGTPILSKDGMEIALTAAGVSKIFRLSPSDPEICSEEFSFPFETGKVAFSFDGNSIAFAYGGQPYLLKRNTGQLYRLDGIPESIGNGIAVFPEFREDGSLLVPYTLTDGDEKMAIVEFEVDPNL